MSKCIYCLRVACFIIINNFLAHGQDTLRFPIDFFEHCQQMQNEDVEVIITNMHCYTSEVLHTSLSLLSGSCDPAALVAVLLGEYES